MVTRSRVLLAVLALALVVGSSAEAQRRRSSVPPGTPANVTPPPSGTCASYAPVRAGLKATYAATTATENATYTVTYISDNGIETKTTQKVISGGITADAETTLQFENVLHQGRTVRALKRVVLKATSSGITIDSEALYAPSFILSPTTDLCVGLTWSSPPVAQTITSRAPFGTQTRIDTTIAWEGEVLAIENVTVPAGTFRSLKMRGYSFTESGLTPTITWTSLEHQVVVRMETLDAAGKLTSTHVLMQLQ